MTLADSRDTSVPPPAEVDAAWRESEAVAVLHALNAGYVRALGEGDVAWCRDHLAEDFVCTLVDGRRIHRTELLGLLERGGETADVRCDDVDVRVLDDVGLVHGVMHHLAHGELMLRRYMTVWQLRQARWQAVCAQFTGIARGGA